MGEETKPEDSSATHYRFRIAVEPGKTEKFSVKESRPEVMRIYLSTLTDTQLAAFVHEGTIKPAVEAELRKTMGKKFEIFNMDQEIKSLQQETELIDKDQARLRENMKALRGSPEEKALLQRYTGELDAQEDRLAALRKEISGLKAKRAQLQAELDTMVMQIGVDETL
jgi:chromosome segregation ATPase